MSHAILGCPVTDHSPVSIARELWLGQRQPDTGELPPTEGMAFMCERSALSAVLIGAVVEKAVVADDSFTGYRFNFPPVSQAASFDTIQTTIQAGCHDVLDELVADDSRLATVSDRYMQLFRPSLPKVLRRLQQPDQDRRQALMFQQAVHDPWACLRLGGIVAQYSGIKLQPEHAKPFIIEKLHAVQQAAHRDVAAQYVRGAIIEAADTLGQMRTPGSAGRAETKERYRFLRHYVRLTTNHSLTATKFGDLYDVQPDDEVGIRLGERIAGFGDLDQKRGVPFGCPAAYRLTDRLADPNDKSALFKLLRAGIAALDEADLLTTTMRTSYVDIGTASNRLISKLAARQGLKA